MLQVALDDPETASAEWRSTATKVLASNDQHARLIDALLTLASSQTGADGHELVDLAATVGVALADLQPEIDRRDLEIVERATPATLDGDPVLVQLMVANLLANAVRYNTLGGRVEVSTGMQEGMALLTIANTGPLIPTAEVARLLQPFQRLDPRRGHHTDGHGLGLAIVQAIADAHRAGLEAYARPGGGLSVEVSFPPSIGFAAQVAPVR